MPMPFNTIRSRIRAEYLEMPGLHLTLAQAQRLFGAEPALCHAVLDALVDTNFLCRGSNGTYALRTDASALRRPRVKATLRMAKHASDAA
jgi:hypothetical protein